MGAIASSADVRGRARRLLSTFVCLALVAGLAVASPVAAFAVTDTDPEFVVTPQDLEFILKQIQISEAHAEAVATGDDSYSLVCEDPTDTSNTCVPNPRLPWGLRTVTGELNNLQPGRDQYGAGGTLFPRLVEPDFRDADPVPPVTAPDETREAGTISSYTQTDGYVYDASPRLISNLIADQTVNNPAAVAAANDTEEFGSSIDEGTLTEIWTELNEDDSLLTYSPPASAVAGSPEGMLRRSNGTAVYIAEPGGSVTFTITDGFRWIGNRSAWRGIAEVYIDDELVATVDQYAAVDEPAVEHFAVTGLGPAEKTVRIVNTGDTNPLAVAARTEIDAIHLLTMEGTGGTGNIFIPDVSPDEGLSAPFTGWFTLFGQFFDHGLDMVEKGGNGTVIVPLREDDPLYDRAQTGRRFLTLTRATRHGDGDEHLNRTTPFVDQNQTYTSHPSHQVFLREYELVDGVPVPTGKLLNGGDVDGDGEGDGMATWGDVKAQARTKLGIELDDMDVHDVPLLATDPYGRFIPGPNGLPQIVLDEAGTLQEGDLAAPITTDGLGAGQAFLDDIAHDAVPGTDDAGNPVAYDEAKLAAHYIAGDGRANENIGLTAVHHVFHSEHNRLADHIEDVLADNPALRAQYEADGYWDYGERLFQAARFVTEMQYQHLVFEEFGRTISPEIDVQPLNETAYHDDLDAAIVAEFAHVAYRFGHSMLTETVDRVGFGTDDSLGLFQAFLNPATFTDDGTLTPDEAAAAVIQGMTRQTGNGIDEFVTDTLRNNLLGLPLDLATINIARARDTGSPTLQDARRAFYAETLDASLKPYANWDEFRLNMKHRASIVNFVAAYGIHDTLDQSTMSIDELRTAATALVANPAFMTAPAAATGLDDVDFWIGGLAEDLSLFGGFLGSTFNHVFERQLEKLQNGDRFYYLTRTQGLNLLHQLENNSFSELIMRNTDASLLHADVFASPDQVFDLTTPPTDVPGLLVDGSTYRYDGEEHVVMHGTAADDVIIGGKGDDSLWGHDGNDRVQGGQGNDTLHGGADDDILQDDFGDDTFHGGAGNDAINAGGGIDLAFGGSGRDFILDMSGPASTVFAGGGADLVRGGFDGDVIAGNEADDWLEGNQGHDLVQGDNALTFQNDPFGGADVLYGGPGNDDHDAEGGDDVMLNNGIDRHAGMLGFDWVTHQQDPNPGVSDLDITVFQPNDVTLMRSRYFSIEGLSGWDNEDVLRGASTRGDQPDADGAGNELTPAQLDRIDGLRELLGGGETPPHAARFMDTSVSNNIILGGAGSDVIEGRAGDDYIDGEAWLGVAIERRDPGTGEVLERGDSMASFQSRVFSGEIAPQELHIVREIVHPTAQEDVCDTATYSDVFASYTLTENADGTWTVAHTDGPEQDDVDVEGMANDGSDIVRNIDRLRFADWAVDLTDVCNAPATGTFTFSTDTPVEGEELTVTADVQDPDGVGELTYEWQYGSDAGWTTSPNGDGTETFVPTELEVGANLRVVVSFVDGAGVLETVTSDPTEGVVQAAAPVVTVPGIPTIGDATAGDGNATVTWTPPADDGGAAITSYDIAVIALTEGEGNQTIRDVPADATSFTVEGLVNGNSYQFRVRAVNVEGFGTYSGRTEAVTPAASGGTVTTTLVPTSPSDSAGPIGPEGPPTAPEPTNGGNPPADEGDVAGDVATTGMVAGGTTAVTDTVVSQLATVFGAAPQRMAGADRYRTAARLVAEAFPDPVETVYVVTGENFPDALAGSAAAAAAGAPVLLVAGDELPTATAAQLRRLQPSTVKVLGGDTVIADEVVDEIAALTGVTPTRLAGADRYETAAMAVGDAFPDPVETVYLATGETFPDALAGSAAAAAQGAPVLLVPRGEVPDVVAEELGRLSPEQVIVLGGPVAVSDHVLDQVEELTGVAPKRLAGADRYETALLVVEDAFAVRPETIYLVTGENFPDALAGSAAAAAQSAPVLLVPPDELPGQLEAGLRRLLGRG